MNNRIFYLLFIWKLPFPPKFGVISPYMKCPFLLWLIHSVHTYKYRIYPYFWVNLLQTLSISGFQNLEWILFYRYHCLIVTCQVSLIKNYVWVYPYLGLIFLKFHEHRWYWIKNIVTIIGMIWVYPTVPSIFPLIYQNW